MYYLQKINEPKTDISSSPDREELMEKMRNLYIADQDTNENNEYRVVSDDDIKKEYLVEKHNISIISGEEQYLGNKNDLRNFLNDLELNNLI
jgi:hypothetical protein